MEPTFKRPFAELAAELAMPLGAIFIGDSAFSFCVSLPERKEERSPLVLRARSLFDQENAVLPLQRATFFNLSFFFRHGIRLDRLFREDNTRTVRTKF